MVVHCGDQREHTAPARADVVQRMYFVVAVAALEIAALFAAALREIARGDADGILVRSGQFLGLAGIGECGFAVTHAVIRRGIQAERRDGPYHGALHRAERTGNVCPTGMEADADVVISLLQRKGTGALAVGGKLRDREAKLDGLTLAGGEQLRAGEAVEQPDRLRTGGVGPGDINLHGLRGGPGLADVLHLGTDGDIRAIESNAHAAECARAIAKTVTEWPAQLRAEGIKITVADKLVSLCVRRVEVRTRDGPRERQAAHRQRLRRQDVGQGRTRLLSGNAHPDDGRAGHRGVVQFDEARRREDEDRAVKRGGHAAEHLRLAVRQRAVGLFRPAGDDDDGRAVAARQFFHAQRAERVFAARRVLQRPRAVLVAEQAVRLDGVARAKSVQHRDLAPRVHCCLTAGREDLAGAEHGDRQRLAVLRGQRQGVLYIFQQHHSGGCRAAGRQSGVQHTGCIFHGSFSHQYE